MDTDIEELREKVQRIGELVEDTNQVVHKMHRAAMWGRIMSFVWWGGLLLITGSVYYYFLLPYLNQIMELYGNIQGGAQQAQGFGSQIQEVLRQYGF